VTLDPRLYRGWATIDSDWNRFYKEFPGVYDRFTVSTSLIVAEMQSIADFSGTRVLNLASGTGKDAFEIAASAGHVIGVEPWIEMRSFAIAKQQRLGVGNIEFIDGVAEDLSRFEDGAFDRLISVHGAPFPWDDDAFVNGCLRVVRPGGYVLFGGTAGSSSVHDPGATNPPASGANERLALLARHGFSKRVRPANVQFGSVEEALATWGFIYGEPAIDYLLAHPQYVLSVDVIVHSKQV
jgi:ubiquinone/menaquinone biosynthesis C-methylase UbiE